MTIYAMSGPTAIVLPGNFVNQRGDFELKADYVELSGSHVLFNRRANPWRYSLRPRRLFFLVPSLYGAVVSAATLSCRFRNISGVARQRRAGAHQIFVSVDVIYSGYRRPVLFILVQLTRWVCPQMSSIRSLPVIVE